MTDYEEIANRLIEAAKRLDQQAEAIDTILHEWEDAINSLKIGVAAGVLLPNGIIVGFGRIGNKGQKWGFYYCKNSRASMQPIFEAPIEARLTLGIHLEYIFKALIKETDKVTLDMQNATKLAREFVAAIKDNK